MRVKTARIMKGFKPIFVILICRKEESKMGNKTVMSIETVIDYIEANLDGKLDLEMVAEAVHY